MSVSGKSHCCNDTFTDVRFTSLLAKKNTSYFIGYFVWNFHSNWLLFLRVMQENKSGCFFWTQKWPWDPHGSVADMFGFASISQVAGKIVSEMTDNVSGKPYYSIPYRLWRVLSFMTVLLDTAMKVDLSCVNWSFSCGVTWVWNHVWWKLLKFWQCYKPKWF